MKLNISREYAQAQDERDPLGEFRARFLIADPDLVYMDGNSLGRMPLSTQKRIAQIVEQEWGTDLIRSWGKSWFNSPVSVGEKVARLVGAAPGQVVVSDSTSINLFKLSMAALGMRPGRTKIISDTPNFPTDLYVLQSCNRLLGDRYEIHLLQSRDGVGVDLEDVLAAVDENTALVSLSHVHFKSGFMYDGKAVTEHCHKEGALVLWDLSHSAGSVPVELDGWDADFATGCCYKYLNGGPGAPAFLYANQRLQGEALSPVWGWFGQRAPFAFELDYAPAEGIKRFIVGTPPVISLLAIENGVDLLLEAGMDRLRTKSIALTGYMIELVDEILAPQGFTVGTPRDAACRGSHVSIRHPESYRINRALIEEMNMIPDFREPDNIRLGLAPLYTSFQEVWEAVDRIRRVMVEGRYLKYPAERLAVT